MPNTFTQLNIHAIFSVKGRKNLLHKDIRGQIFQYIHGICRGIGLFPLAVNGYSDHVHVFFELSPSISVAKALQDIKANSSKWINQSDHFHGEFSWQAGYGAFTYSRSQRDHVIKYITNQEQHHSAKTFRNEYLELLKLFEIQYDERYLFEFYDDII